MKRTLLLVVTIVFIVLLSSCAGTGNVYRIKIIINHSMVFNEDQRDFPVLLHTTNPALKSKANNGHVSRENGEDIFFTITDGKTVLPSEIQSYEPDTGTVRAWVKIPSLSSSQDTELYLCYGGKAQKSKEAVWDTNYTLVEHLDKAQNPDNKIPDKDGMGLTDQITVQAWVYGERSGGEALEPLVSKWAPGTTISQKNFRAYDASKTDGLNTRGYFGAVFDGRYVYFAPQRETMIGWESAHGHVLRYDTQKEFMDETSWDSYNASYTDGLETRGHYGAVFDGRYVFIIPRGRQYDEKIKHQSRFLRYDTHRDFKEKTSWSAYDFDLEHSHQSAGFDGRYIYVCPGSTLKSDKKTMENSTIIIRLDTQGPFKDPTSYTSLDVKKISDQAKGNYDGAAFDGRYMYFIPLQSGITLRFDTTQDFHNPESWETYDGTNVGMRESKLSGDYGADNLQQAFVGATFDGTYLYFDAYAHTNMIRYNTRKSFTDDSSWENFEAGKTPGLKMGGFDGGFFDGRYVWYVPYQKGDIHCNWLRYDTEKPFDAQGSWDAFDASGTDGLQNGGYNAGAFDGRFFYTAPFRLPGSSYKEGVLNSGNVMRADTLPDGTGSFSLRYCDYGHNGGLNAALTGPSFIVNTVKGAVSIFANRALVPGWHHLTGVYNGNTIKLFVDGILVNERSGSGTIQNNTVDIEIGRIQKGSARFTGRIDEVRISNTARNDNWIKTEYQNLSNPSDFIRVGKEEAAK